MTWGNTRKIPDQDLHYPIIPDWLNIRCKYPYPIHTPSIPKSFFQYPNPIRPEVENPYPLSPGPGVSSITISPSSKPQGIISFRGFVFLLIWSMSFIRQSTQIPQGACRLWALYPGMTYRSNPFSMSLPSVITRSTLWPLRFQHNKHTFSRDFMWEGILSERMRIMLWKKFGRRRSWAEQSADKELRKTVENSYWSSLIKAVVSTQTEALFVCSADKF